MRAALGIEAVGVRIGRLDSLIGSGVRGGRSWCASCCATPATRLARPRSSEMLALALISAACTAW